MRRWHVVARGGGSRDQPCERPGFTNTDRMQGGHRITDRTVFFYRRAFIPLWGGEYTNRTGVILFHTTKHA